MPIPFHYIFFTLLIFIICNRFATNPQEILKVFKKHKHCEIEKITLNLLNSLLEILDKVTIETKVYTLQKTTLKPLQFEDGLKELRCLIKDFIYHVDMFGVLGIHTAAICYLIQLECLILHCEDVKLYYLFKNTSTTIAHIKHVCEEYMDECSLEDKLKFHVSDQVKVLIEVLREFRNRSDQELASIVFVDRRFTAKILYHILKLVSEEPEFSYIKPDYIVGYNNNPYNNTRESLYVSKQNKRTVQAFCDKEVNLMVSSNVLEEGIDIPNCTLVVKFNKPTNYRSYVQSKGRARHKKSFYYILVSDEDYNTFKRNYMMFCEIEKILNNVSYDEPVFIPLFLFLLVFNRTESCSSGAISERYRKNV